MPLSAKQYRDARKLIDAIEANDIGQVKLLLDSGADPNQTDIPVSRYWTIFEFTARRPLTIACETGNLEMVRLLIEHGATAENREYTGWSPLRKTLFRFDADDAEIVKLLLANGADPSAMESDEIAVFAAADMYPMLFGSENYLSGYDEAVAKNITQIVFMLLGDNEINMRSSSGNTLLMYAAIRGNIDLAENLIARGCDVNLVNNQGKTAYDLAVENGRQSVAELIKGQENRPLVPPY